MKKTFLALSAFSILLTSCGGKGNSNKTSGGNTSAGSAAESKADDGGGYTDIIGANPGEVEAVFGKIAEKSGIADPEILEIYNSFSDVDQIHREKDGTFNVQLVSKADRNKIAEYDYDWEDGSIKGPTSVSLSTGIGSDEKFIDTYDGYKEHLFHKADFDFAVIPAAKKDALERAKTDYGAECYVETMKIEMDDKNGKVAPYLYVSVQSKRSLTASKSYYYDRKGVFVKN